MQYDSTKKHLTSTGQNSPQAGSWRHINVIMIMVIGTLRDACGLDVADGGRNSRRRHHRRCTAIWWVGKGIIIDSTYVGIRMVCTNPLARDWNMDLSNVSPRCTWACATGRERGWDPTLLRAMSHHCRRWLHHIACTSL